MNFGFSYIGLIFLLMLMIPNIIWSKNKPKDYDKYSKNENKLLLMFERIGEALVICISLIFINFNINELSESFILLIIAFILMILYEIYWIRYFKSNKTMKDMYSNLIGVPIAGAPLPILAFLILGKGAMAWMIDSKNNFVWRNGATSNFNSYIAFCKEKNMGIVILSNLNRNKKVPTTVIGSKMMKELCSD